MEKVRGKKKTEMRGERRWIKKRREKMVKGREKEKAEMRGERRWIKKGGEKREKGMWREELEKIFINCGIEKKGNTIHERKRRK